MVALLDDRNNVLATLGPKTGNAFGFDFYEENSIARKPPVGVEPTTTGLQNRCSAN